MSVQAIQWWCSARGVPWAWSWQAYPGVWLFVGLAAFAMWRVVRGGASTPGANRTGRVARWRRAAAASGAFLLWAALDWPVGPLGAGYLASVHALQFIVLAMLVPPLFLAALEPFTVNALLQRRPSLRRALRAGTQPLVAMVGFTIVMAVTHVPNVVDVLMRVQWGAFLLDVAWLASGLVFWWPVVVPEPVRAGFVPPLRMLYLFFGTQAHLLIAMWLLLAEYPVYATYELAPRVTVLSALHDQQLAGGLLLIVAGPAVLVAITVIFFRWAGRDSDGRGLTAA